MIEPPYTYGDSTDEMVTIVARGGAYSGVRHTQLSLEPADLSDPVYLMFRAWFSRRVREAIERETNKPSFGGI